MRETAPEAAPPLKKAGRIDEVDSPAHACRILRLCRETGALKNIDYCLAVMEMMLSFC